MRFRSLGAFGALAALAAVIVAVVPAAGGTTAQATGTYIVQMAQSPVVAYEGGIAGFERTKPAKGEKINPNSAAVRKYAGFLDGKHAEALQKVGGGQKVYDYRFSYNGFAAKLTEKQAERLELLSDVVAVEKAAEVTMDTATTPSFLGLTDPNAGLWAKHNLKGEDVVIGVVDSGVWPENPAFSDRDAQGKRIYQQLPSWHGKCAPGENFNSSMCNQKLIGAQFFCEVRGCSTVLAHEFLSPRDYNGHGSHTASTAGGNEAVPTTGAAALFGTINGMAPRARLSVYKVCWDNGEGGCGANTGDSVAAIDQAVADGVDVINYSISGTSTSYLDAVEVAYLFAADAGVFVATSAGNSGPGATTVAHISPWLAAVGAGTHNRSGTATVTLGNAATYTGASLTAAVGPAPVVLATESGKAGADPNLLRQCFSDPEVLDPAKVTGKIVVCERGGATPNNARVDKSVAVKNAGGVGMILYNTAAGASLNADLHSIPTVHVDSVAGAAIVAYVSGAGASATASLSQAIVNTSAPAPDIAAFSSRGPSIGGGGDILKPDFFAPGVDILAAVAPPGNAGKDFDIYSGTSMSSPHVAGLGALLTQAHPDWSPAAMRSALATTASPAALTTTNPLNIGSGHVRPNLSIDPGLVYDADFDDYRAFLRSQRLCTLCFGTAPAAVIDPSDLNQPSIAIGDLAGTQTVKRSVTNVGPAATYTPTVVVPTGFTASTVAPLTLATGETKAFEITFTRTDAPFATFPSTFRSGSITWSDGTHSVRSPIVLRAVPVAVPASISGTGTSGSTSFSIRAGYTGSLTLNERGLIPATTFADTVADDPTDNFVTSNPDANQGIKTHDVVAPADATYLRVSLFDEFTDGEDDLDLYVYRIEPDSSKTLVGTSGGGTAAEEVNITGPTALVAGATYRVYVHGWQTDGPDAQYTLFTWALGSAAAGNLDATPDGPIAVTTGGTTTVNVAWSGLAAATKYLGQIAYNDGATTIGTTVVRIDTP
jgi:subtilisin family serine protease